MRVRLLKVHDLVAIDRDMIEKKSNSQSCQALKLLCTDRTYYGLILPNITTDNLIKFVGVYSKSIYDTLSDIEVHFIDINDIIDFEIVSISSESAFNMVKYYQLFDKLSKLNDERSDILSQINKVSELPDNSIDKLNNSEIDKFYTTTKLSISKSEFSNEVWYISRLVKLKSPSFAEEYVEYLLEETHNLKLLVSDLDVKDKATIKYNILIIRDSYSLGTMSSLEKVINYLKSKYEV